MKRRWRIALSAVVGLVGTTLMGAAAPAQSSSPAPAAYSYVQSAPSPAGPEQRVGVANAKTAPRLTDDQDEDYRHFCARVPFVDPSYFCGDPRLGPRYLPDKGVLGKILLGYHRLAGKTPADFLQTWWSSATQSYIFPPFFGFDRDVNGNPISTSVQLRLGQKIDRFGGEGGNFLSPAGTPFKSRALPPQSLNTSDATYPFNYHVYEVLKPFTVTAGPIAPWFGQPGQGVQYQTAQTQNVAFLVQQQFLRRVN